MSIRPGPPPSPHAGPSRLPLPPSSTLSWDGNNFHDPSTAYRPTQSNPAPNSSIALDDDEDNEDERMDLNTLQSFASKIQQYPQLGESDESTAQASRIKVVIPKRGEKDFEPLQETVNLQEMMLQRSREALFGALVGVRGGHSKTMSHAVVTPSSPYPRLVIARGHLLDTMGISVRHSADSGGRARTFVELLPEEALYLLERGSLQIWFGTSNFDEPGGDSGAGEWCEEEMGVKGAVELSVMEGFGIFLGKDGLTWERYQAYAYLKRLGYTVHRTRRFIPSYFLGTPSSTSKATSTEQDSALPPFRTWWRSIPGWVLQLVRTLRGRIRTTWTVAGAVGLQLAHWMPFARTEDRNLLTGLKYHNYPSVLANLKLTPTSHAGPVLPLRSNAPTSVHRPQSKQKTQYADPSGQHVCESSLNPYTPFWHVWKPAAAWSKANWDRGSPAGLSKQKPEYAVAAINARSTPMPSIQQLAEIFDELPEEPKGPTKKIGPQYERRKVQKAVSPSNHSTTLLSLLGNLFRPKILQSAQPAPGNPMGALRNGDKALVVAVNDSGNTGWVRFGRSDFAGVAFL